MIAPRRAWGSLALLSVMALWMGHVPVGAAEDVPPVIVLPTAKDAEASIRLSLQPGELRVASVDNVTRVAVGKSDIVDVSVISPNQLLLHAKSVGKTNLILWTSQGQQVWALDVIDRTPETTETQLHQLLDALGTTTVQVKREQEKLFLLGHVDQQQDLDRLEQMLSAFPPVTNLVRVVVPKTSANAAPTAPPLVSLSVQVIEISRTDLEKLGVKWSESIGLTEPEATDLTFKDAMVKWGTSLTRTSIAASLNALVEQNRARLLAEPKLVTTSGKEASTFVGVEVPVLQATSTGTGTGTVSTNIEFKNTGVTLKMTPKVLEDHRITTTMEAEVSDVDSSVALAVPVGSKTVSVPGFSVRKANTEVTTRSGETVLVAGLLKAQDSRAISQVPALGSLPVLGRLFRSPEIKSSQREMVIAVTPSLVEETGHGAAEKNQAVDQALARAEITLPVEDPLLGYALQVQERIATSLRYPMEQPLKDHELGMTGRVKLRLHLFHDGTLDQVMVVESSGLAAFDQAVIQTAWQQSPYPAFPAHLARQDLWLELPVLFRP